MKLIDTHYPGFGGQRRLFENSQIDFLHAICFLKKNKQKQPLKFYLKCD